MPRFHLPLVEPDVRISRIRLSDKEFMLSPTRSGDDTVLGQLGLGLRAGDGRCSVPKWTPALSVSPSATDGAYGARGLSPPDRLC